MTLEIPKITICDSCPASNRLSEINASNQAAGALAKRVQGLAQRGLLPEYLESPELKAAREASKTELQKHVDEAIPHLAQETSVITYVNGLACEVGGLCVRNAAYTFTGGVVDANVSPEPEA